MSELLPWGPQARLPTSAFLQCKFTKKQADWTLKTFTVYYGQSMILISTDSELEDQVPWCIVSVCCVLSGGGETRYQSALLAFTTQSPGCWIHSAHSINAPNSRQYSIQLFVHYLAVLLFWLATCHKIRMSCVEVSNTSVDTWGCGQERDGSVGEII